MTTHPHNAQRPPRRGTGILRVWWVAAALMTAALAAGPLFAHAAAGDPPVAAAPLPAAEDAPVDEAPAADTSADDALLSLGADVYSSVCSSCHQPGGVGLGSNFPPLKDNPNVADAEYVRSVIQNGRSGEIVVNGVTYDGVMPSQSTLSDDDVEAVIFYIQSGFASPSAPPAAVESTGPVAGTQLPPFADMTILAAFAIAAGALVLVFGPRLTSAHDRRTMPWLDAWLKTAVIAVGFIVATLYVPAKVLEIDAVQDLPREMQDLIAVGLWFGGLAGGIWALWYAHREQRI